MGILAQADMWRFPVRRPALIHILRHLAIEPDYALKMSKCVWLLKCAQGQPLSTRGGDT
jgi:hypothetical protein